MIQLPIPLPTFVTSYIYLSLFDLPPIKSNFTQEWLMVEVLQDMHTNSSPIHIYLLIWLLESFQMALFNLSHFVLKVHKCFLVKKFRIHLMVVLIIKSILSDSILRFLQEKWEEQCIFRKNKKNILAYCREWF